MSEDIAAAVAGLPEFSSPQRGAGPDAVGAGSPRDEGPLEAPAASPRDEEVIQEPLDAAEGPPQDDREPEGPSAPPGGHAPDPPQEEPEKLALPTAPGAEGPGADGAVAEVIKMPGEEPAGRWSERSFNVAAKSGQTAVQGAMRAADKLPSLSDCPTCPSLNIFDKLSRLPGLYCDKLGHYPWAFAGLNSLILIILVSSLWRKVEVNTDVDSFYKVDSNATMYNDVYEEALSSRKRHWSGNGSVEGDTFQLTLLYQAKDDSLAEGSILSEAALRDIQTLEQELLALDGWSRMCEKSQQRARYRCQPGETLGNYVWPTRHDLYINASGEFGLSFQGTATESLPIPAVLAFLDEAGAPLDKSRFLPLNSGDAKELRSVFTFTAPGLDDATFQEEYEDFVRETLYPKLLELVDRSRETPDPDSWDEGMSVTVFYSGDYVDEHEVRLMLESGMRKASGGLVFAFLLAWAHLGSLFLAFFGTWLLCMAPLLTWGMLRVVDQAGLATFLSVFLTFGLGGNVLYYTASAWDRSRGDGHARLADRVMAMHLATILRLLPPLASGGCFLVLLASLLRPLREMGLFAGVCMVCSCALCLGIFIPLLVFRERFLTPRLEQSRLPEWLKAALEPKLCAPQWKTAAERCVQVAAERGKWLLVGTAIAVLIMFCITVGVAAVSDNVGLPEVFPPDHQRAARRAVEDVFAAAQPSIEQGPSTTKFCEPHVDSETTFVDSDCGLFWCRTLSNDLGQPKDTTGSTCTCHRDGPNGEGACSRMTVHTRFSGSDAALQEKQDLKLFVEEYINATSGHSRFEWSGTPDAWSQRTLALEHWLFGEVVLEPLLELPVLWAGAGSDECEVRLTCHCGVRACGVPADEGATVSVSEEELASARRLSAEGPPLEEAAAPAPEAGEALEAAGRRLSQFGGVARSEVNVIFGITTPEASKLLDGSPEWGFDPRFNASSPAAQRAIHKMCTEADAAELKVESSSCWIDEFKSFLEERGESFPTCRFCSFDDAVQDFLEEHPERRADMWLDPSDKVMATVISFSVDHGSSASELLESERRWRSYIARQNEAAESTASRAWATSVAWVDAEAYDEALASSWRVVLVTLLLLSVVGLVYTMDFRMTGAIVGLTFCCLIVLHFLMYCIFQWDFGPWELVITVVFLCYAMEPAFQIGRLLVDRSPAKPEDSAQDPEQPAQISGALSPMQEGPRAAGSGSSSDCSRALPEPRGSMDVQVSQAVDGGCGADAPAGQDVQSRVARALHQVVGDTTMVSLQLWICGCFLASCEFRLFSRLGFLAMVSPLLWLPAVLLLFPATLLCSSHAGKSSDVLRLWSVSTSKLEVLIS